MDKKEKEVKKEKEKKEEIKEELDEDKAGFPEDVDLKKFLGCGG